MTPSPSLLQLVERVVFVLDVRAVEHHEDDEEPLVGPRPDERILLPRPFTDVFDRLLGQAKATARFDMRALAVRDRQTREKVHGRLVVADCGQHPGERHFDRPFGPLVVVRRLLDVPLATLRILHRDAGIGPLLLSLHERVNRIRVRRALSPHARTDCGSRVVGGCQSSASGASMAASSAAPSARRTGVSEQAERRSGVTFTRSLREQTEPTTGDRLRPLESVAEIVKIQPSLTLCRLERQVADAL